MGLIPNLSRADSKDLRVSSTPSLSSFVELPALIDKISLAASPTVPTIPSKDLPKFLTKKYVNFIFYLTCL